MRRLTGVLVGLLMMTAGTAVISGGLWVEKTNPKDGARMVWIPAGTFLMGDEDMKDNPRRKVELSGFWIYKDLVTVKMYRRFCQETKHEFPSPPSWGWKDDHPITRVDWFDATAYGKWANAKLPTEAQWERVARGEEGRLWPWGNTWDPKKAWTNLSINDKKPVTAPVGKFGLTPEGISDMAGNLWQWCQDVYDETFPTKPEGKAKDPVRNGPLVDIERVQRGGSWDYDDSRTFRTSNRGADRSTQPNHDHGFRCVVTEP